MTALAPERTLEVTITQLSPELWGNICDTFPALASSKLEMQAYLVGRTFTLEGFRGAVDKFAATVGMTNIPGKRSLARMLLPEENWDRWSRWYAREGNEFAGEDRWVDGIYATPAL